MKEVSKISTIDSITIHSCISRGDSLQLLLANINIPTIALKATLNVASVTPIIPFAILTEMKVNAEVANTALYKCHSCFQFN